MIEYLAVASNKGLISEGATITFIGIKGTGRTLAAQSINLGCTT